MDWPVLGAIGGVAVLAVAVTVGALAVVRATPEPPKRLVSTGLKPLMRIEARPEIGIVNAPPQQQTLDPADFGPNTVRMQPKAATPQAPPSPKRTAPPEHVARPEHARPVPAPSEQLRPPTPAHGPVATGPAQFDPRVAPGRPPIEAQRSDPRYEGVLTLSEISRIRASMRLSPQQEPHWRPVEAVLRDIGRQQTLAINAGRRPEVDSASVQRLAQAAQPLVATLRPDQKEQFRRLGRQTSNDSVAAQAVR